MRVILLLASSGAGKSTLCHQNSEHIKAAMDALQKHNWSGNIRELRNVVERLIILSAKTISADDVENYVLPRK